MGVARYGTEWRSTAWWCGMANEYVYGLRIMVAFGTRVGKLLPVALPRTPLALDYYD